MNGLCSDMSNMPKAGLQMFLRITSLYIDKILYACVSFRGREFIALIKFSKEAVAEKG